MVQSSKAQEANLAGLTETSKMLVPAQFYWTTSMLPLTNFKNSLIGESAEWIR